MAIFYSFLHVYQAGYHPSRREAMRQLRRRKLRRLRKF